MEGTLRFVEFCRKVWLDTGKPRRDTATRKEETNAAKAQAHSPNWMPIHGRGSCPNFGSAGEVWALLARTDPAIGACVFGRRRASGPLKKFWAGALTTDAGSNRLAPSSEGYGRDTEWLRFRFGCRRPTMMRITTIEDSP